MKIALKSCIEAHGRFHTAAWEQGSRMSATTSPALLKHHRTLAVGRLGRLASCSRLWTGKCVLGLLGLVTAKPATPSMGPSRSGSVPTRWQCHTNERIPQHTVYCSFSLRRWKWSPCLAPRDRSQQPLPVTTLSAVQASVAGHFTREVSPTEAIAIG